MCHSERIEELQISSRRTATGTLPPGHPVLMVPSQELTLRYIYRPDLRAEAVARASAIKQAQRQKKEPPKSKLRGAKARKAAEVKSTS